MEIMERGLKGYGSIEQDVVDGLVDSQRPIIEVTDYEDPDGGESIDSVQIMEVDSRPQIEEVDSPGTTRRTLQQVQDQPEQSKTRDWSDICGLDDDLFISCCRCCFYSCNKLTRWTCGIFQMTITGAAVFLIVVTALNPMDCTISRLPIFIASGVVLLLTSVCVFSSRFFQNVFSRRRWMNFLYAIVFTLAILFLISVGSATLFTFKDVWLAESIDSNCKNLRMTAYISLGFFYGLMLCMIFGWTFSCCMTVVKRWRHQIKYDFTARLHSGYDRSFEATLDNTILPVYTNTGRSHDYYTTHRDSIFDSYNYNLL